MNPSRWRAFFAVAAPVVLCLLGGIAVWQSQQARSDQARALVRVDEISRKQDEAVRARHPGEARKLAAELQRARRAERDAADDMSWYTWALGLLTLPAAGLLLLSGSSNRREQREVRNAERRLQALVQHSSDMIMVLGPDGTILTQTGAAILGHRQGELIRRRISPLVHADDATTLSRVLNGDVQDPAVEWRLQHASGAWLHVESAITDMREDEEIGGIVLTSRDITERKASEAQLRHRAFHDPLTQLPNRALFYDRIEHALHRAAREGELVAVCILDLDDFKGVNDTLGHAAGDELLIQVAQRLRGALRTGDTAARLGGDEFGILLEGVAERSEPIQIADRLLSLMRQQFEVADRKLDVLPSVGVAITEGQDEIVEDLLRHADVAMYAAKRNGKGRYEVFDPSLADASAEDTFKAAKRGAAAEDEHDSKMPWFRRAEEQRIEVLSLLESEGMVTAQFQPLLDLRTARIAGFEALARFAPKATDRKPPNVWFSQAHRAGLGPRLEAAALRAALSAPGRPPASFLTLNVSPSSLASDEVREVFPDDLSRVVVEITENELVTAAPSLHETLDELRGRGARIAVDDAGAGYAGFTQLLRLRPDIIKLDRALVHGVSGDDYRAALIGSFVRFARSIDSLICAEGIESMQDLRTLADLDVTYGQGYALAAPGRPWPEVDLEATETCYAAWQGALHGHNVSSALEEGRLERVASKLAAIRGPDEIPAALDEVCRDLGAERAALRRVTSDGSLVTVGGAPLTSAVRIDERSPEFATAAGRLLVLPIETAGTTHGLLELMAPEGRPWHRSEIHRARVLAQLFSHALTGAAAIRLAAA